MTMQILILVLTLIGLVGILGVVAILLHQLRSDKFKTEYKISCGGGYFNKAFEKADEAFEKADEAFAEMKKVFKK